MELKQIAVDTSKSVFTVQGIDAQDQPMLRRNFSRSAFEAQMAGSQQRKLPSKRVAGRNH